MSVSDGTRECESGAFSLATSLRTPALIARSMTAMESFVVLCVMVSSDHIQITNIPNYACIGRRYNPIPPLCFSSLLNLAVGKARRKLRLYVDPRPRRVLHYLDTSSGIQIAASGIPIAAGARSLIR